jgi:ABC-type dipeptide/oligopeptide/nickel transport system permease component
MKYILKRLGIMLLTLLLVSMLVFFIFSIIPGDGVLSMLGTNATPERVEAMRESMGLNQPVPVRYVKWLAGLFQGDLGTSMKYRQPVASLLADKLEVTLWLSLLAFILIFVISVPLGILISRYADKAFGRVAHVLIQIIMAVPSFFMGILLVLIFGLILKWFTPYSYVKPSVSFWGFLSSLLPAALAIAIPKIAMVVRFLRGSVLAEQQQDYVRTAYSKGADTGRVYYVHILKNAMIPVVTILGMMLTEIMAGSIVIEQVFNLPGLGRFLVSSIGNRDFPVVSVIMLYMAAVVVVLNSLVDILYHVIDPRITAE